MKKNTTSKKQLRKIVPVTPTKLGQVEGAGISSGPVEMPSITGDFS